MKICTEVDYLQAHVTLISKAPCGRNPNLPKLKQRLASILITLRLAEDNQRVWSNIDDQPFEKC
jgi:hypothetical protein